ncbi:hypothetical protein EJ05DRAFT_148562 [Pseudovirgaria hyperparasitica]|uniref:N-acetyltransferase domain-containing protein n=1 Tax=Pseudovirgaria hyperparasitica TaxID=470096 RepID=A0A6A6VWC8_9PEZI|nr:uncharacterized protein EJ05DRAFT_148562 [Pseudovirgaria hyperparasitica]KAF2754096.1 hypothetical protein EJ05DRAFT_148562 [Pseudovirgaria hyperparasitica]
MPIPFFSPPTPTIVAHSNVFHSPLFANVYPLAQPARYTATLRALDYLIAHQLAHGTSLGVYDTEYQYRTDEARRVEGLFYDDAGAEATVEGKGESGAGEGAAEHKDASTTALHTMDFPLVSVAMAYDASRPLDPAKLAPLMEALPCFAPIVHELDARTPAALAPWTFVPSEPEAEGEKKEDERENEGAETLVTSGRVLMRQATSTRRDYEGLGLMKGLARYMMLEAARCGYEEIRIDAFNGAVRRVWMDAPAPARSVLVAGFNTRDVECEGDGEGGVFNGVVYDICRMQVVL